MLNNESFFNSEEQKLEQKLLALVKILKEEGEFNVQNVMRMKYAPNFKNQELFKKDGDLFLTVDSLIRINNIITNSHNLHLRRHNVKPAGYNKQYMDASRIETELHSLVDKFNDIRITSRTFCDTFLIKYIHLQTETVEHAKFYSMTRLKISIKFIRRLAFDLIYFLFRFVSGPLQNFVSRNVIFSKLCSVFYKYDQRRICFHDLGLIYRSSQSYYQ